MQQIKDLSLNPQNPRKITDTKLKQLKKALAEFGDLGGFVFNRSTNRLVGGHQRAKAFDPSSKIEIEKSYKTPTRTGTVAEGFVLLNGERFKYREVEWDEIQEKAANIAANKGAGEWDNVVLAEWMKDLEGFGMDLDLTMFDDLERLDFLGKDQEESEDGVEVSSHIRTEAVGQSGDVFTLDRHRLMLLDLTDEETFEKLVKTDKKLMLLITPRHAKALIEKWEAHTGLKAKKISEKSTKLRKKR